VKRLNSGARPIRVQSRAEPLNVAGASAFVVRGLTHVVGVQAAGVRLLLSIVTTRLPDNDVIQTIAAGIASRIGS
jgi:hypothetical protein